MNTKKFVEQRRALVREKLILISDRYDINKKLRNVQRELDAQDRALINLEDEK